VFRTVIPAFECLIIVDFRGKILFHGKDGKLGPGNVLNSTYCSHMDPEKSGFVKEPPSQHVNFQQVEFLLVMKDLPCDRKKDAISITGNVFRNHAIFINGSCNNVQEELYPSQRECGR
jgi:hypothetical protein